jgi:predicted nucleic acid-binding protein
MPYLLDTNVITQLLKRTPQVVGRYRAALERGEPVYLSAVVYYEVKRGFSMWERRTSSGNWTRPSRMWCDG